MRDQRLALSRNEADQFSELQKCCPVVASQSAWPAVTSSEHVQAACELRVTTVPPRARARRSTLSDMGKRRGGGAGWGLGVGEGLGEGVGGGEGGRGAGEGEWGGERREDGGASGVKV